MAPSRDKPMPEVVAELQAMRVPELVERYAEVFGKPPRCKQPTWLWRRIAAEIQMRRYGGLSKLAKRRLEELIAEIDLPLGKGRASAMPSRRGANALGTEVVRVWKGREIRARRVEAGWECDGVVHRSLSAVAKHVTGSHWNGRLFFGLTRRRAAQ